MLKKLIITIRQRLIALAVFLCSLFTVNCLAQNVYNYNTLDDATSYTDKYAPVAAPMAYAPDGILYTTGLYDKIVMIGDDILEPVATSAYLSAVDNTAGKRKWTIGIMGAARITAVCATSEAVFVAGVFADDITLGSKDYATVDYSGTSLSHEKVNGFVAKYSPDGNLLASKLILPHENVSYSVEENDLMVYPTAIAPFNGRIYLSMTFNGGYDYDGFSQNGNVKSSFGYWDSKCADIIALSSSDLSFSECIYDLRNSEDVNTNGYAPSSICITSTADNLYIGAFTSQNCTETVYSAEKQFEAGTSASAYYFTLHAIDKSGNDQSKTFSAESDRAYINNLIRNMSVTGGKLYLAGCTSSPLPFDSSLSPDLWCDQFAACLSSDFNVTWAGITGAKRDDMATTNEKYRLSNDAAFSDGKYIVIGSTNFQCNGQGSQSPYSADYCLGIAGNDTSLALSTKTDTGSLLSITSSSTGITDITTRDINSDGKFIENQKLVIVKNNKKYSTNGILAK